MAMTPGPWAFDGRRWIRDATGIGVLRLQNGANPDDARAAAAAPEMLAVLHEMAEYMGDPVPMTPGNIQAAVVNALIRNIRAAISAAEGDLP